MSNLWFNPTLLRSSPLKVWGTALDQTGKYQPIELE
jgi:hypothetical protein